MSGYVHMACCGGVLGEHRPGCEDAEDRTVPEVWPAERGGRMVWITEAKVVWMSDDEIGEASEIEWASQAEARAWLEAAA